MIIVSSAMVNKVFIALLVLVALYFGAMDLLLYARVKNYQVRPTLNVTSYPSIISCDINPLCTVTVKGLMLDHPNHYLLSPLAALVDNLLGISRSWTWVTPNSISFFHVLVAVAAGKCVSSDSLSHRRLGVVLFQIRTWLDDLDGRVARKRANILGERSDVGSIGYLVDGICDALGCVALTIGLFHFLARNPAKRAGYDKLYQLPVSHSTLDVHIATSKSTPWNAALKNVMLLIGHLLVISFTWNRYISLYQDLLETESRVPSISLEQLYARQTNIFRSNGFWAVILGWKAVNFHAALDYLLLAIFLDRVWEYMRFVRWTSYIVALLLVYVTEFHFTHVYAYVHDVSATSLEHEVSTFDSFSNR